MSHEYAPRGDQIQALPAVMTVVGGDARLCAVAGRLAETVCTVRMFAVGEESATSSIFATEKNLPLCFCRSLWEAWAGSRIMVLPLPVTRDGETVFCPLAPDGEVTLNELTHAIARTAGDQKISPIIFGGKIPTAWRCAMESAGGVVYDYLDREDVQVRNAHITAEGAVMTAMEMTDVTLQNAPVAILGYGRIGQLTARMLIVLGAEVTVFARRAESRAWAIADGAEAADIVELADAAGKYTVLINTVPAPLLTAPVAASMRKKSIVIDLASPPGGLSSDAEAVASARGWPRVVHALSLPGRYAPVTAGQVIADSILDELTHHSSTAANGKEGG